MDILSKEEMRTLREGSEVICVESESRFFTKGKKYTVKKNYKKENFLTQDCGHHQVCRGLSSKFRLVHKFDWIVSKEYPEKYEQLITLPDGSYCYTLHQPVIEELNYSLNAIKNRNLPGYRFVNSYGVNSKTVQVKGKTLDGVPFGQWTIDFGE